MKDTSVNNVIALLLVTGAFWLGFSTRGFFVKQDIKQEVKEETIKRIAYAIQSGMLTVNHDKIVEISQKTKITNLTEAIQSQVDMSSTEVKSEDNSEDLDSTILCTTNNENRVKLPEEG